MDKIQNVDLKVVGVTFTNEDTKEKRADIIAWSSNVYVSS